MRFIRTALIAAIFAALMLGIAFIYIKGGWNKARSEATSYFEKADKDDEDNEIQKKLKITQAIIEGFDEKKELITYEAQLSQVITWDESWGEISMFHKSRKIKFYGVGIYICDLNMLTEQDIGVDTQKGEIEVIVPAPIIKDIIIDENKTEYEDVEKGWLRFGEVKLTPEQYEAMLIEVKESMMSELKKKDYYEQAKDSTALSVEDIFNQLVKAVNEDFTVLVKFR